MQNLISLLLFVIVLFLQIVKFYPIDLLELKFFCVNEILNYCIRICMNISLLI
jgi:hypothetical protein